MGQFTNREKAREAQAEVSMRRKLYTSLVSRGKLTAKEANKRIAIMTEIQEDYRTLADNEIVKPRLL